MPCLSVLVRPLVRAYNAVTRVSFCERNERSHDVFTRNTETPYRLRLSLSTPGLAGRMQPLMSVAASWLRTRVSGISPR